jgi:hypothetical protein
MQDRPVSYQDESVFCPPTRRRRTIKPAVNQSSREEKPKLTLDGSVCAGSESEPSCGAHPAPIEDATSVGTIVMREGLSKVVPVNARDKARRARYTYNVGRSGPSWRRAERLLMTNEEERTRPPRTLANMPRLSRTRLIAKFHSPFGRVVGNTSGF